MQSLHSTEKELVEAFTKYELISVAIERNEEIASIDFRKIIFRCASICSIKNKPDELTISVLWDYTKKNLMSYTFKEIEKAVIFNQSGQLADTIEHFQVFDLAFFTKVMELWLILKTQTRSRIAALLPKPKESEPETPEQKYQGLLNYINKNQSFPDHWAWLQVWDYMESNGLIKDSEEEKRAIWKAVKSEMEMSHEMEMMTVTDFIERTKLKEELPEKAANEYRKKRIIKNLSYLITSK